MSQTVDDLLRYARNEQVTMRPEELVMGALVAEVADEFQSPAAARQLRIVVADADGTIRVVADRAALRQALANLLDNAVRLAPQGSTIEVSSGADANWAWAAVADEGPGIAADEQALVFRRFWRGSASPAPDPAGAGQAEPRRGSGLGLAIVDQIMTAHGGAARVASEPGRGSVFSLWVPVRTERGVAGADPGGEDEAVVSS